MEAKLSNQKSLDELPRSDDKDFWYEAEVNKVVPHSILADHGHYFKRVSGHQAYCDGCGWGFQLDWGDKVIDGHVYDKKGRLVI
jgi:hypothetical protein